MTFQHPPIFIAPIVIGLSPGRHSGANQIATSSAATAKANIVHRIHHLRVAA